METMYIIAIMILIIYLILLFYLSSWISSKVGISTVVILIFGIFLPIVWFALLIAAIYISISERNTGTRRKRKTKN